ncbi:hypothetical protein PGT21_029746 [Puccinia graminis f. sp. tritici]|uniref:Uncharacterized protein n=1 Tax=Puccinia graminis f. sp. tritici TaxID=56615 RepID=A0A5B0QXJ4_PUCGR|nr:hypothetical protein PGT21_029746 [Puccinia graminis f. sp. tritici]
MLRTLICRETIATILAGLHRGYIRNSSFDVQPPVMDCRGKNAFVREPRRGLQINMANHSRRRLLGFGAHDVMIYLTNNGHWRGSGDVMENKRTFKTGLSRRNQRVQAENAGIGLLRPCQFLETCSARGNVSSTSHSQNPEVESIAKAAGYQGYNNFESIAHGTQKLSNPKQIHLAQRMPPNTSEDP